MEMSAAPEWNVKAQYRFTKCRTLPIPLAAAVSAR